MLANKKDIIIDTYSWKELIQLDVPQFPRWYELRKVITQKIPALFESNKYTKIDIYWGYESVNKYDNKITNLLGQFMASVSRQVSVTIKFLNNKVSTQEIQYLSNMALGTEAKLTLDFTEIKNVPQNAVFKYLPDTFMHTKTPITVYGFSKQFYNVYYNNIMLNGPQYTESFITKFSKLYVYKPYTSLQINNNLQLMPLTLLHTISKFIGDTESIQILQETLHIYTKNNDLLTINRYELGLELSDSSKKMVNLYLQQWKQIVILKKTLHKKFDDIYKCNIGLNSIRFVVDAYNATKYPNTDNLLQTAEDGVLLAGYKYPILNLASGLYKMYTEGIQASIAPIVINLAYAAVDYYMLKQKFPETFLTIFKICTFFNLYDVSMRSYNVLFDNKDAQVDTSDPIKNHDQRHQLDDFNIDKHEVYTSSSSNNEEVLLGQCLVSDSVNWE